MRLVLFLSLLVLFLCTPSFQTLKRAPFSSWAGKRSDPALQLQSSEERDMYREMAPVLNEYVAKRRQPAFSSWAGKRAPFSSWAGKRSNGWDDEQLAAVNEDPLQQLVEQLRNLRMHN